MKSSASEPGLTQRVFLAKKVKNISEMEWNSFVCFAVNKENGREPGNTTREVLCTVFTHSLFLYQKSYSFAALTRSISDTSTTRA